MTCLVFVSKCLVSTTGAYNDLDVHERACLACLQDDFQSARAVLDGGMVTLELDRCEPLLRPGELHVPLHGASNKLVPFDHMPKDVHRALMTCTLQTADCSVESVVGSTSGVGLLQLLPRICARVSTALPPRICAPACFATQVGIAPQAKEVVVAAALVVDGVDDMGSDIEPTVMDSESQHDDMDAGVDDDDSPARPRYDGQYPMSVLINCVRMSTLLKNPNQLPEIIRLASALVLPPEDHAVFLHKLDTDEVKVPSQDTIYRASVKLDYLSILYQRRVFTQARISGLWWSSQLGADSSPQTTYDFINTVEDRFVFKGTVFDVAALVGSGDIRNAFTYIRRSLGCQVLGFENPVNAYS